jgi:hypothetical protein
MGDMVVGKAPRRMARRAHGGKRPDLANQYFRSMWEANFARYLNWLLKHQQIRAWEYEPDTFWFKTITRGSRFYTPDFKVIENDSRIVYYEIKGYMDSCSNTKLKRMAKYYPHITIRLIGEREYRNVAKKVAGLIAGWETQRCLSSRTNCAPSMTYATDGQNKPSIGPRVDPTRSIE